MAINLAEESTRHEFVKQRKLSEKVRDEFNENRIALIMAARGDNWNAGGKQKQTITSLMWRAYETFGFDLSMNRPKCQVSSLNQQHSGFARAFGIAINNYAKVIKLDEEIQAGIMDALFGLAVFKRYWAPMNETMRVMNPDIEEPGMDADHAAWKRYQQEQYLDIDPGEPMIERLCPEDWIPDTAYGRRRHFRFECHRYRRPLDEVRNDRRFDEKVRKALKSTMKADDRDSRERAERLSQMGYQHEDDLERMVTLWDVWLPKSKQFAILSDDASLPPLMLGPWKGAPGGPFTPLIFSQLPDNFEPVSLMGNLYAIHETVNSLMRKMIRQAARQKDVTVYAGPEPDALRMRDTPDGGMCRVASPEAMAIMSNKGVNPSIGQLASSMQQMGNTEGGNLALISGTAPQSETASQDEMLNANSSAMQGKRMQRVANCVGELYGALGWMLWHDVAKEVPGTMPIPEYGIEIDATWKPDVRYGEIEDYQFSFTPFNDSYRSPSQQAQVINGLITEFYVPLLPIMQQSGQTLDFTEMSQTHAELLNAPEIQRFIKPYAPPQPGIGGGMPGGQEGPLQEAPSMPSDHVYEHRHNTTNPVSQRGGSAWSDMAAQEG